MTTTTFEQAFADGPEAIDSWLRAKDNYLTQVQAETLGTFMNGLSYKGLMFLWLALQRSGINLALVHPIVKETIVRLALAEPHVAAHDEALAKSEAERRAAMAMTGR